MRGASPGSGQLEVLLERANVSLLPGSKQALNLILLAVSAVGHWSLGETFFAVGSVILLYGTYMVAYVAQHPDRLNRGIFFNNLYFLALTGIIVISGNYVFNRLRFREFALRFELDQNRRTLEEAFTTDYAGLKVIIAEGECQLERQRRIRPLNAERLRRGARVVRLEARVARGGGDAGRRPRRRDGAGCAARGGQDRRGDAAR